MWMRIFVSLLVFGPYLIFLKYILLPWSYSDEDDSVEKSTFLSPLVFFFLHLCMSTFLVGMIFSNYMLSCLVDPGGVPQGWKPDTPLGLNGKEHKYCQKCLSYKPERAHHCRSCDKCQIRMDHHCVWISNCVGLYNHKYFILFLFYVVCAILYAAVVVVLRFLQLIKHFSPAMLNFGQIITFAIFACLILPIGLAVGALFFWQLSLLVNNMTTIENEERERSIYIKRKSKKTTAERQLESAEDKKEHDDNKNYYDLGTSIENLRAIMGRDQWFWLLPTKPNLSEDGLNWRKAQV
eukprot:TRINITY_DN3954_c0_g2_i2.p1 TRINITY_DN3954_c0_g2~~TRINITY_DN3954_c0_g2_i2.p1  ORF type:complete len:294 (-),score=28.59 TRINITY_DN3954_c0_g2_i2:44-925(-)